MQLTQGGDVRCKTQSLSDVSMASQHSAGVESKNAFVLTQYHVQRCTSALKLEQVNRINSDCHMRKPMYGFHMLGRRGGQRTRGRFCLMIHAGVRKMP